MHTFTVATQDLFETLAESLEDGEPLPAEVLITYLRHPETAIQELAAKLLQQRPDHKADPLEHFGWLAGNSAPAIQQPARRMLTLLDVAEHRLDKRHQLSHL